MIALGVRDLPRSVRFYRDGLGFLPSSASKESIAFFKMGGTVLALYLWDKLAEDAQVPGEGHGFRGVILAHNVRERKEVSEVLTLAAAAGGKIIKAAQDVFWGGHSGYFADPEVCWNPHFPLAMMARWSFRENPCSSHGLSIPMGHQPHFLAFARAYAL
jgi:catechol 2,3-dioxygenase-like lactoylglutathione lyase family enzyme